jgi:hypothetical protein
MNSFINTKKATKSNQVYVCLWPGRTSKISRPASGTKTPSHHLDVIFYKKQSGYEKNASTKAIFLG